jgi:uncharacterized protein YdhG (YjbR/CyaY superfamily)
MRLKGCKRKEKEAASACIASLPDDARASLRKLRRAIAAAAPRAKLGIRYGIPAFKVDGHPLVWFVSFNQQCGFLPGAAVIRRHGAELRGYKVSKGAIRFPPDRPLPARLVAKLVKTRMADSTAARVTPTT